MKFYSQYGQDKWLYENYFKDHISGVFLEIGADDGIDKSNTKFFEESLGWTGLCVEPSPKRFSLLEKNRTCACEQVALSDKVGTTDFFDISGWGKGLSGIVENYDPRHADRVRQEIRHPQNAGSEIITVNTEILENLLEKHMIYHVDFCSIDTEGSELDIIKTIDFKKYKIDMFMIENNYNDRNVKEYLEKNNYKFITRLKIDDVYVRIR